MLDLKGRYKWDAWAKKKGMSLDEAKGSYIEMAGVLMDKYK
jgi:acyl-CoA-binding protein